MPLSLIPAIIVGGISTLTASGTTMLVLAPESDLARTGGAVGVILAAVCAANAVNYTLIDRRLRRVELLTGRVVRCERAVLDALNDDAEPGGRA